MINIKICIKSFDFELSFEDRELVSHLKLGFKTLYQVEKSFHKKYKCIVCGKRVIDSGLPSRFCDEHHSEFVIYWHNRLQDKK